jgi:hypothetical protein
MREARVNHAIIQAEEGSPEVAECPMCGGEVRKRKRRVGKDRYTYFYRHHNGVGSGCALRYRPTS